jgi:Uma2 family endonuclease
MFLGGHAMSTAVLPTPLALSVGDDDLYEVIDGARVGKEPMGIYAVWVASELHSYLAYYARINNLGWALTEALFHLPSPINRDRRPDVAFVSYKRWPMDQAISLTDNAWDVVPNVATEVVSPTDTIQELETKIGEYFQAGVELVWVVYPPQRKIHVYESPTKIQILTTADVLDGGAVVPGFRLALAELFSRGANGK